MSGTQFLNSFFQAVDMAAVNTVGSPANNLTALGTTRATALQLTARLNNVTTAAASTGVTLPPGIPGVRVTLFNAGANAIQVYGSGSDTIDTIAGSTGVVLTAAARCEYFCVAPGVIVSAKMGAVSS